MDTTTIRPGQVDPQAVERLKEQEEAARAAGFALRPPVYALGTRVIEVGADNFRRSRMEFNKLPHAKEALALLIARIAQERRQDTVVPVASLRMLDDGRIVREGGSMPLLLGESAFRQLVNRTACPEPSAAATYLATIPTARRAREVNAWLAETDGATAMIRHRDSSVDGAPREAYAIVSERYCAHDVDELARDLERALLADLAPGDARVELEYDGLSAALTLRWHSDIQPETCAAGEVFRAAAGIRTADDGSSSITPFAGLDRNLCLNLIILDEAEVSLGKRRHTGNGVASFLGGALKEAVDRVRWFAEKWDGARSRALLDPAVVQGLPDYGISFGAAEVSRGIFRGLLASGAVSVPGYRATTKKGPSSVDVLQAAFDKEPEPTVAGIVNAVTRAAHEAVLKGDSWAADKMQRQGAALLTRKAPLRWVGEEV